MGSGVARGAAETERCRGIAVVCYLLFVWLLRKLGDERVLRFVLVDGGCWFVPVLECL